MTQKEGQTYEWNDGWNDRQPKSYKVPPFQNGAINIFSAFTKKCGKVASESADFLYCRFSLFLKDSFFADYVGNKFKINILQYMYFLFWHSPSNVVLLCNIKFEHPIMHLRAISENFHAHHSCVEKQEKLSGSHLSDHLRIQINTNFQILLCQMYISTIFDK